MGCSGEVHCEQFFETVEAFGELGEALEDGDGTEPDAIVEAGRAGDHFAWGDIVRDGGLGGENDAVADGAVAGDADLAGEDDIVADDGRAGQAGLRAEECVAADAGAVADLDEVVDFGAVADDCFANCRAVDGGVGLHIDMAADADGAGLGDFLPVSLIVFGEAEAVGADDDAVFERDVIAEDAVLADDAVSVREEVAADLDAGINDDVRQECCVRADADVGSDDGVSADVRVCADLGGGIDDGGGMDAGRVSGRLIEEGESAREGVIGVLDAKGGGGNFLEFGLDEDGGGAGGAGERSVFGIGDEGDFARGRFFDAFDAGDFEIGIAAEFRAETACELAEVH